MILQLLEIPDEKAQNALKGVIMELEDCAFPLLAGIEAHATHDRLQGHRLRFAGRAHVPAAQAWSVLTCWLPTPRSSPPKARL